MRSVLAILIVVGLAACASDYEPKLDGSTMYGPLYRADLQKCRELAEKSHPTAGTIALSVLGGVAGAALGLALRDTQPIAAIFGGAAGAATAGIAGAASSASGDARGRTGAIDRCMRNRGYVVKISHE